MDDEPNVSLQGGKRSAPPGGAVSIPSAEPPRAPQALVDEFVEHSSDAVIIVDVAAGLENRRISWVNEAFTRLTGYRFDEVLGRSPQLLNGPLTDRRQIERLESMIVRRRPFSAEVAHYRKNGTAFWADVNVTPLFASDGTCTHVIGVERDVTRRKHVELLNQGRTAVLESIAAGVPLETAGGLIVEMIQSFFEESAVTVHRTNEGQLQPFAIGTKPRRIVAALHEPISLEAIPQELCEQFLAGRSFHYAAKADGVRWETCERFAAASGLHSFWTFPIGSPQRSVVGAIVLHFRDETPLTELESRAVLEAARLSEIAIERDTDRRKLERKALYDPLTELPNRALFADRLAQAMALAARRKQRLGLALLDLDRFKLINDGLGHAAGDTLLKEISRRFRESVRGEDTIARIGGDEFLLLLRDVASADEAEHVVRRVVESLRTPFDVGGQEVFVSASAGISIYPEHGRDADDLIRRADAAMYAAKQSHNVALLYDSNSQAIDSTELMLDAALHHALERGEFALVYQPIVNLRDGSLRAVEALLRWNHPVLGTLAPGRFIALAEASGLMVPIGAWVIEQACEQARRWQDAGRDIRVGANLSLRQFDSPGLVETVRNALERTGLERGRLVLELTEHALMRSPDATSKILRAIRECGARISLDDFGTGYSSLAHLKNLPIDSLKIDMSFIREIGSPGVSTENDEAIVRTILAVAAGLGLSVVAEGIEREEQAEFLRRHGCAHGQGFLYGKPGPASAIDR
jgi:diguanylate cyclase (GGDEF)-like protein/PAS domain S-box-containing protein